MRILFVTQVPLASHNGGARHVIALAKELVAIGHDLVMVAPGTQDIAGARVARPPRMLRPGTRMEAALAIQAMREVLGRRPDVAYVRLSPSSSFVPEVLHRARVPLAIELNGSALEEMRHRGDPWLKIELARRTLGRIVRRAEAVVVPLPVTARHAREVLGARDVAIIENGADLDVAVPGARKAARAALGLPDEPPLLAMVGTLVPEIRLDLGLAALDRLPGIGLLAVGDGDQAQRLEDAATRSSRVRFLGRLPHEDAVRAIQASDVCLNLRDGWVGMKSLEYAAIGRRQVVFETDGVERLLALYAGLEATSVVRDRTPEGVAAGIESALDAERRLGPLPEEEIGAARETLGWAHTARGVSDLLEEIVRRSPRRSQSNASIPGARR